MKQTRIIMEQPFFKKGSCIKWYFLLMILIAKSNSGSKFLLQVILSWMNHWHVLINIAADFCRGNWLTQSTCFRFCRKVRLIFIILVVRHIFIISFHYSCKFSLKRWRSVRRSSKGPSITVATLKSVVDSR